MARRAAARLITTQTPDVRLALRARIMASVDFLLERATPADVASCIAAPTGTGSMARLVASLGEVRPSLASEDPLAAAYARTALWKESYAAATPMYTPAEAVAALGITSTEALRKRDRAHTILALPVGSDEHRYPTWQIRDGSVVSGLAAVRAALGTPAAWVFAGQLEAVRAMDVEATPTLRELLLAGRATEAVRAAHIAADSGGA